MQGNFTDSESCLGDTSPISHVAQGLAAIFPAPRNREMDGESTESKGRIRERARDASECAQKARAPAMTASDRKKHSPPRERSFALPNRRRNDGHRARVGVQAHGRCRQALSSRSPAVGFELADCLTRAASERRRCHTSSSCAPTTPAGPRTTLPPSCRHLHRTRLVYSGHSGATLSRATRSQQ
jgi:hypothetical protein